MLYCTFNAQLKKLPTPKTSLHFCFISDLKAKILLRSELVKMIGKVAMLVGLVSKPELNGRFVQVEGFDEGLSGSKFESILTQIDCHLHLHCL